MFKCLRLFMMLVLFVATVAVYADDSPPSSTNSFKIVSAIGEHYVDYMHWRPIGVCVWLHWSLLGPHLSFTLELDQYQPDLIVTTFNESGDDPWTEARVLLDRVSNKAGSVLMKAVTGDDLTDGHNSSVNGEQHNSSLITKTVDVIGSPMNLLELPFVTLTPDTTSYVPYFQSALDAVPGRFGIAEALRPETWNPLGHYIGTSFLHHWAYEFPRSMRVDNNNDFKASVSIALHAADIVTNKNTLHVVHSTKNTCGKNCAVANVVEENNDQHEIWQEIYPHNTHVQLGQSDLSSTTPLGQADEKAGHGNYVFVIWRHYRGCVQSRNGHFLWASVNVPATVKR